MQYIKTLLIVLIFLGGVFRFYNLNWGAPYFFHPDERNITSAVLNIHFPNQLNPHFFAYGAFPIYLTALVKQITEFFLANLKITYDPFALAILIGRFLSAFLSTLLIPLVFLVSKRTLSLLDNQITMKQCNPAKLASLVSGAGNETIELLPYFAAFLTAFNPGLIQFAHFSTFEIFLTVEYLLIAFFALQILITGKFKYYLLFGFILGLAVATKINSLIFLPILFLAHWSYYRLRKKCYLLFVICYFTAIAFLASPFNLLDYSAFRSALNYESSVALGTLPVFYTQGFIKTNGFLFPLTKVFPYLLGWPLVALGILGLIGILAIILVETPKLGVSTKDINTSQTNAAQLFLIFFSLPIVYWLFNSFLFVQWLRYSVPLIPFIILATIIFFSKIGRLSYLRSLGGLLLTLILSLTLLFGFSLGLTYFHHDTRIQAAQWLNSQTKNNSQIINLLSEVYDLGIVPFNTYFNPTNITLFDFYSLDPDPRLTPNPKQNAAERLVKLKELSQLLEKSDYIVLPSPRIWRTRLRLVNEFPAGYNFYQKLFEGTLGFKKAADFQNRACDRILAVNCLWLDDNLAEETYTVFERPEVIIFQKEKLLTKDAYFRIINTNQ